MVLETKAHIEEDLKEIWQEESFTHLLNERNFLYPETIDTNVLLFIGINPGYSDDTAHVISYPLEKTDNKIPYFKKLNEVATLCDTDWTHLDLLFLRETDQSYIHKILRQQNGVPFISKQLELSDKLIRLAGPKVIVVSNVLAGIFLGKEKDKAKNQDVWLDYEFTFDDEIGTYRWNGIPVFFSSMLSGQRALDKGSRERLIWQIRRAIQIDSSK